MTLRPRPSKPPATPLERSAASRGRLQRALTRVLPSAWLGRQSAWALKGLVASAPFKTAPTDAAEVVGFRPKTEVSTYSWVAVLEADGAARSREALAARLVFGLLLAREKVLDDAFTEELAGAPLETLSYENFFSTALVPASRRFAWVARDFSPHVVVLTSGRAFRVDLTRKGELIDQADLCAALKACVAQTTGEKAPCAATGGTFARFADVYAELCTDERNFVSLRTISSATLVVCLDESEPRTDYDVGFEAQCGSRDNRWFMHGLQLVVSRNARAAIIGNLLLGVEGSQAVTVLNFVASELAELGDEAPELPSTFAAARALRWSAVSALPSVQFQRRPESIFTIPYGARFAKRLGLSATCGFHLTVLAAIARSLGPRQFTALQLVNTRHDSSLERMSDHQLMTPEIRQFCQSLWSPAATREEKRDLLAHSADSYARSLAATRDGLTFAQIVHSGDALERALRLVLQFAPGTVAVQWSLLPRPTGVVALGRFGVEWPKPETTAGHALIGDLETTIHVVQGAKPLVDLRRFSNDVDAAVRELSQLCDEGVSAASSAP